MMVRREAVALIRQWYATIAATALATGVAEMDDLEQRVAEVIRENRWLATPAELARAIIPLVLEHAAKVAESKTQYRGRTIIAAAIRAIGAP